MDAFASRSVCSLEMLLHEAVGVLEQGAMPDSHRRGEGGKTSEAYVCSDERTVK